MIGTSSQVHCLGIVERPLPAAVCQRRPFHDFEDKGASSLGFFQPVDVANVEISTRPRLGLRARTKQGAQNLP